MKTFVRLCLTCTLVVLAPAIVADPGSDDGGTVSAEPLDGDLGDGVLNDDASIDDGGRPPLLGLGMPKRGLQPRLDGDRAAVRGHDRGGDSRDDERSDDRRSDDESDDEIDDDEDGDQTPVGDTAV